MFKFFLVGCFCFSQYFIFSQKNSRLLDSILKSHPLLKQVIVQKEKFKPQIIFTQINRDAANKPSFVNHTYFLDSNNYFYCASLVKLPTSIFALEKINSLSVKNLSRHTIMQTDSAWFCQKKEFTDTTSKNGFPSLEHHIKKMFLVSDNNSFNRVFELATPMLINKRLSDFGFPKARIVHRLDANCVGLGNNYFNPIRFVSETDETLYTQPADSLSKEFEMPFDKLIIGRNIYNKRKRLISSRKDFSKSNYLPLKSVHMILQNLVFHQFQNTSSAFNISSDDWQFLMQQLGRYPRESDYPKYDQKIYYDSFKKYFIYGSVVKTIDSDSLRIFNIVGRAYGFLIDCAYIVDFNNKTEFVLSSVIYTNKRNSFGTGKYEYDTVGLPFLKELSLALYTFESKRKKKYLPNLNAFNLFKTP